ncbi:MAG: hypothetical protein ACIAXF_12820 [Phycisphaerales bacterium JB063]
MPLPTAILNRADGVLRARPIDTAISPMGRLLRLAGLVVLFGMLYGGVMGTFGGLTPDRALQISYSAVKVPMLLFITFALGLPSFFVVNTLLGLRDDLSDALRALVSAQAGLTVVLASLAPFTAFWYVSSANYSVAILFNAAMFATASFAGQAVLRKHYAPLIARNPRHRLVMWCWLVVYAFVGIQMGWVLRPFIGSPDMATRFFREGAWSNAYLELIEIIGRALGG